LELVENLSMRIEAAINDPLEPIVGAFNTYWTALREDYVLLARSLGLRPEAAHVGKVNSPTFRINSANEIAILIHGFMGSPAEMSGSAQVMEELGFSVLNILIPGFGADSQFADHFTAEDWERRLDPILDAAIQCFSRVHLVGFSTGGLLIHSYLRRRTETPRGRHLDLTRVKSASLYSPFYAPHYWWAPFFAKMVVFFVKFVSVIPLFRMTRFRDLQVMTLNPQEYLQRIPLQTGRRIEVYGQKIANGPQIQISIPALLFLSKGDRVLNQKTTEACVRRDFSIVEFRFFETNKVPHHLMVKAVHPAAPDVWLELKNWVKNLS
jgi:alpha-beta hydrolase superfamily lysophospholipase